MQKDAFQRPTIVVNPERKQLTIIILEYAWKPAQFHDLYEQDNKVVWENTTAVPQKNTKEYEENDQVAELQC